MKRFFIAAGVLLALVVCAALWFGRGRVNEVRERVRTAQERALADWRTFAPRIEADVARWRADPLILARDGGDAAPLLFEHVRWDGVLRESPVPYALTQQLNQPDGGWVHAAGPELEALDVSWLSGLQGFGYWNAQAPASMPFKAFNEPLPKFTDAQLFAKAALVKGLAAGDARPAARDVRELARLCFTTEQLIGEMIAVSLLNLERRAYDQARARGQSVEGWEPVSEADVNALKRVAWAAVAPHSMMATGDLEAAEVPVGYCTGLGEGVLQAYYLRGYLETELPLRYAAIERALAQQRCRLVRARAAWTGGTGEGQLPVSGEAFCMGDDGTTKKDCAVPGFVMSLPFVRPFVGNTLVLIAAPDWLKQYRE